MRSLARLAVVFLAGNQIPQPVLSAADKLVIDIGAAIPSTRPEEPFLSAKARLDGSAFDPAAQSVLSSTEARTRRVFRIPHARLDRFATYRASDGDCLVASWELANGSGVLNVDDTPYQATYSFRLEGPRNVTAEGFSAFIGGLVNLNEPPLRLELAAFTIRAGPAAGNLLHFTASDLRSPYAGSNISVWGGTDGSAWYVNWRLPKTALGAANGETICVPERFPPLSELLKTWNFDHIWSEVGHRNATPFGFAFGNLRDRLLIAGLARRGVSQEQFVALLVEKDVHNPRERLSDVWLWGSPKPTPRASTPLTASRRCKGTASSGLALMQQRRRTFLVPARRSSPCSQGLPSGSACTGPDP